MTKMKFTLKVEVEAYDDRISCEMAGTLEEQYGAYVDVESMKGTDYPERSILNFILNVEIENYDGTAPEDIANDLEMQYGATITVEDEEEVDDEDEQEADE